MSGAIRMYSSRSLFSNRLQTFWIKLFLQTVRCRSPDVGVAVRRARTTQGRTATLRAGCRTVDGRLLYRRIVLKIPGCWFLAWTLWRHPTLNLVCLKSMA